MIYIIRNLKTSADAGRLSKTKDEVQRRLLLNVVVRQSAAVLKLLARKDQALLVRRNALLVLDLGLHVLNCVRGLNVQCDGLARKGLHEDLHPTAKTKDEVQRRLLLNVVVRQSAAVLKLLAHKDQALLVR